MKTLFSFLLAIVLFTSCSGQNKDIQNLSAEAYSQKLKSVPDAQLLDVRTPEEFASDHLDGAVNVDWNGADFAEKAKSYDKSKPVFLYCKVGGRSAQAADKLHELGFTEIYNLNGGIMKWNAAGLSKPLTKQVGMTSREFESISKSDKKVLVNFYADWCAPCKKMAPYMTALEQNTSDNVKVVRVNADDHKSLVANLKIDELPVLQLYEDNKIIWEHKGFISEEELKKHL